MTSSTHHKVVLGALRSCIAAHGPITMEWIESASKRVVGQLAGLCEVPPKKRDAILKLRKGYGRAVDHRNQIRRKVKECLAIHSDLYQDGEECPCRLCDVLREALAPTLVATDKEEAKCRTE